MKVPLNIISSCHPFGLLTLWARPRLPDPLPPRHLRTHPPHVRSCHLSPRILRSFPLCSVSLQFCLFPREIFPQRKRGFHPSQMTPHLLDLLPPLGSLPWSPGQRDTQPLRPPTAGFSPRPAPSRVTSLLLGADEDRARASLKGQGWDTPCPNKHLLCSGMNEQTNEAGEPP